MACVACTISWLGAPDITRGGLFEPCPRSLLREARKCETTPSFWSNFAMLSRIRSTPSSAPARSTSIVGPRRAPVISGSSERSSSSGVPGLVPDAPGTAPAEASLYTDAPGKGRHRYAVEGVGADFRTAASESVVVVVP